MIEGAFAFMQHDHFFRALPWGTTEMKDRLIFGAPIPVVGAIAEFLFLRRYMAALLRQRNTVLKRVAESNDWAPFRSRAPHAEPQATPDNSISMG